MIIKPKRNVLERGTERGTERVSFDTLSIWTIERQLGLITDIFKRTKARLCYFCHGRHIWFCDLDRIVGNTGEIGWIGSPKKLDRIGDLLLKIGSYPTDSIQLCRKPLFLATSLEWYYHNKNNSKIWNFNVQMCLIYLENSAISKHTKL